MKKNDNELVDFDHRKLLASNLIFNEYNGLLVMEAESVPIALPWKFETNLVNSTGPGYYRFDGNTIQFGKPLGKLEFKMKIKTTGLYQLLIRSYKNHKDHTWSNDCYTRLVGHPGYQGNIIKTFAPGKPFKWIYHAQFEVNHHSKPTATYNFTQPGIYTLEVYGRSKNFHIDRFILFDRTKHTQHRLMITTPKESNRTIS